MTAIKKELYQQLQTKINEMKANIKREIDEVLDFAKANDLVVLPVEVSYYSNAESLAHLASDFTIPTDQQIAEDWTSSNIDCGYKPDPEPFYPTNWSSSDCEIDYGLTDISPEPEWNSSDCTEY